MSCFPINLQRGTRGGGGLSGGETPEACLSAFRRIVSAYQGMRRPRRVQEDLLMQKPTRGSVKASQARPTKRIMEAGSGFTCQGEEAKGRPSFIALGGHPPPPQPSHLDLKHFHTVLFLESGFLCVALPWLSWKSLCKPGWL